MPAEEDVCRGLEMSAGTFEHCIVVFEPFVVPNIVSVTRPGCKEPAKFLPIQEGEFVDRL